MTFSLTMLPTDLECRLNEDNEMGLFIGREPWKWTKFQYGNQPMDNRPSKTYFIRTIRTEGTLCDDVFLIDIDNTYSSDTGTLSKSKPYSLLPTICNII